jgi:hypothetical protein
MREGAWIAVAVILLVILVAAALVLRLSAPRQEASERVKGGAASPRAVRDGEGMRAVDWPSAAPPCYPAAALGEILRTVRALPGFGPATSEQERLLESAAARISAKYGVALTPAQLISIRNMEVALEAQRAGVRALKHGKKIAEDIKNGETVLAVSSKYNLPPLTVLKQALLERGFGEASVKAMVANPITLPHPLAGEAAAIFEADLSSQLHAERTKARAQAYENAVGEFLRAAGARFETENELRAEQIARLGAPRLTPDFLFREPVRIHGRPVYWLDAKNYPMYGGKITAKSIARQAVKYTEAFGPGAMVFSGGLVCNASVLPKKSRENPLLLDGSFIRAS